MELGIDRAAVDRCRDAGGCYRRAGSESLSPPIRRCRSSGRFCACSAWTASARTTFRFPTSSSTRCSPADRSRGAALAFGRGLAETGLGPAAFGEAVAAGRYALADFAGAPDAAARGALRPYVDAALARIRARRDEREP